MPLSPTQTAAISHVEAYALARSQQAKKAIDYFHPSEEKDLRTYLHQHAQHYFVVEEKGTLVGAGGYNFADDHQSVRISWDLVPPAHQDKGIGKALLRYRLDKIKQDKGVKEVIVRTSQMVWPFYEKLGFVMTNTKKDIWAEGFDLYQMRMSLDKPFFSQ